MVKACEGETKWLLPLVFWADCATTLRSTGFSPFNASNQSYLSTSHDHMATFLVFPALPTNLNNRTHRHTRIPTPEIHGRSQHTRAGAVPKTRFTSVQQFETQYDSDENTIRASNFKPGHLVLVCNAGADPELRQKIKPRYYDPMVVIRGSRYGVYCLPDSMQRWMELFLNLRYATF